jgi:hypothetical protein
VFDERKQEPLDKKAAEKVIKEEQKQVETHREERAYEEEEGTHDKEKHPELPKKYISGDDQLPSGEISA